MFRLTHQRYLISRFRHIEALLGEALDALEPRRDQRLFADAQPDATPAQRKILADHLTQIRFDLRRFMQTQQLKDTATP